MACSENAEDNQQAISIGNGSNKDRVPVEFSISDKQSLDFTRSATSIVTFDAGEAIKVFVKPYGASSYTGYDYTTASAGQNVNLTVPAPPAIPPYYPPGSGTTVEAYAYYPSIASTTFTVQNDQTSDANYKASDLMYADHRVVTKGGTDGHDHLAMAHQMAQLKITAQAQAGSGITISEVQVIAQKSVTFVPNSANIVTTTGGTGTIKALSGAGTGYVVIPQQVINGVTIKVITGAGTADLIATYAFTGTGNFESGNSYTIDLTVSPDQLGFTTAINNWNGMGSVNVVPAGSLTILDASYPTKTAIPAQEYTGNDITPSFIVKKGDEDVAPSYYDVIWVNNRNAGKAYIIVTGKGTQEGAVGMTSFTITPANGKIEYSTNSLTKKYGNEDFTHQLLNHHIDDVNVAADGPVTYTSSKTDVATVDDNGKVTLLKAGTTRITATATNGANYVYSTSAGDNTAYYDLTVEKGDGSISFGYPTPSQTYSLTTEDNKYTQAVTKTGDATVTYSIGSTNTCDATIDPSTGEVRFNRSGSVQVIATVEDTDRYTYASKTASYTLTVDKLAGNITLSLASGSVVAGNSATITVASCHDVTRLRAVATGGATTRVGSITISGSTITVPTNGTAAASYVTITVYCDDNDYYATATATYTLTITRAMIVGMNPLYYVSENPIFDFGGTSWASYNTGYFFSWDDAMAKFAAQATSYDTYRTASKGPNNQWHLPIQSEWWSIVPSVSQANIWSYDNGSGTLKSAYISPKWGYNSETKAGISETSYWKYVSSTELHAIRFLGTEYCSAWKYELLGSFNSTNYGCLRISATMIEIVDGDAAATWYSSNFDSVTFGDNESVGAVRRDFYAQGYRNYPYGSGSAAETESDGYLTDPGGHCNHWSATQSTSGNAWNMRIVKNTAGVQSHAKTHGFIIRLFKDN